jgi:hypothetical protein
VKIDKHFSKQIKDLDRMERNADKDRDKEKISDDDRSDIGVKIESIRNVLNARSSAATTAVKAQIRIIKFGMSESRKIVARACGNSMKVESALLESMVLEAEDPDAIEDADKGLTAQQEEEVQQLINDTIEDLVDDDSEDSED